MAPNSENVAKASESVAKLEFLQVELTIEAQADARD